MDSKLYPQLTMRNKMRNTLSREKYIVLMQCISEYLSYFLGNLGEITQHQRLMGCSRCPSMVFSWDSHRQSGTHRTRKAVQNPGVLLTQPLLTIRFMKLELECNYWACLCLTITNLGYNMLQHGFVCFTLW